MAKRKKIDLVETEVTLSPVRKVDDFINDLRVWWATDKPINHLYGLRDLAEHVKNKLGKNIKMAELGSYAGVSTELWAVYFDEVHAIDAWDMTIGKTGYTEIKPELIYEGEARFDQRMKPYDNVKKVKSFSVEASENYKDSEFDFVYIDSDHRYDYLIKELKKWRQKVKKGGFIAGHDYPNIFGVRTAVNEIFKRPQEVFSDGSWIVAL